MSLRQCVSSQVISQEILPRDFLTDRARRASRDHCGAEAGGPVRLVALRSIGGRAGCVLPPLAAAAGRRGGLGACLGAEGGVEPVVSDGDAGSAFMMVTGGIDAADGKNRPPRPAAAVGGCASPSPVPVATAAGGLAPAGHAVACR